MYKRQSLSFASCKKDNTEIISDQKGNFTLEFENKVNDLPLILNTQNYINANGDNYTISTFKYYISNIKLSRADGTSYSLPESYYLIDASKPSSTLINLRDIPAGDYTKISYLIGCLLYTSRCV